MLAQPSAAEKSSVLTPGPMTTLVLGSEPSKIISSPSKISSSLIGISSAGSPAPTAAMHCGEDIIQRSMSALRVVVDG
jgi:hypothetical protein